MNLFRILPVGMLASLCLLDGDASAQVVTEFSAGITANAGPLGITEGPDGNLWFTEYDGKRIGRITPAGVVTEFSAGISVSAQIWDITTGPDGNLWFTEGGGNRIGRITPTGVVTEFSAGISVGAALAALRQDRTGICGLRNTAATGSAGSPRRRGHRVQRRHHARRGSLLHHGRPRWQPVVHRGHRNRIGRITTAGVVTEFSAGITVGALPRDITAGPDGNLWFTEYNGNRIGRITPSGVVTEFSVGLSPATQPNGITVGPDGNLWFTELSGDRIGRITPAGVITEFSTGITANASPFMITVGPDDNLWFTEYAINRVGRITVPATPPAFLGAVSRKVHGPAGTFDLPLSMVATAPTTEPRQGSTATVVLNFNAAIVSANVAVTAGSATAGALTFSGSDVIVPLTGVIDQQYVTVSLTNVSSAANTGGSGSVRIGFLAGDVSQNRVVTVADLGLVNAQLSQPVSAANYLKDVNATGTLTVADKGITNANLTKALPAP